MSQLVLKQQKNTYFVVLKFVRVNNTSTESIIIIVEINNCDYWKA